jgi:hypothetical protein
MLARYSLALIAIALTLTTTAHAVVTTDGYYRLGETEGGVPPNGTAVPAQDASPNNNHYLNDQSGNFYSNNVSFAAQQATGSTISVSMNGSSGGFFGITSGFGNDNVGVELFVETNDASKSNNFLAGNGNNTNGIGLAQNGNVWQGLLGNVAFVGSAPVKPDQWAHLAIVREDGTSTFYVNGVPRSSTTTAPLNASNPHMGVISGGSVRFGGTLDEVRNFSFASGAFNPADLLINQNLTSNLENASFENVTGNQADYWNGIGNIDFNGLEGASDGSIAAVFNGGNTAPNGELMQTFETVAGVEYKVEFDFGKFATGGGTAEVTVDVFNAFDFTTLETFVASDASGTAVLADVFDSYEFSFVAADQWTTLRFTDTSNGTNSFDGVLDNVSISAMVPEPASFAVWVLAALGVAGFRRYRSSSCSDCS